MSIEDFKDSWEEELDNFKQSVDDEQYQFLDVGSCDCVFSKEEIEKYSINNYGNLVALCDEDGYIVPRGLTREERRKHVKDYERRSSYGLTKEKAESISKNTEEAYKSKYFLTKEQVRKIGEHSLRKYAETSPSDFKVEDFIDLTNESDKGDIVSKL